MREHAPRQAAPHIEWQRPAPVAAPERIAPAKEKAGDSWSSIIGGMFNFGRKKRIDFRLATPKDAGANMHPQVASMAPMIRPPEPPKQAVPHHVAPARAEHESREHKHDNKERKSDRKGIYHLAPKRERPSGFDVNLMPQELISKLSWGGTNSLKPILIAVIVPLIVISLGYVALILLQNDLKSHMAIRQAEFDGLERQIGDFIVREKQNNQVADRVAAIKQILDNKVMWSNFFSYLEKYTLDGIYFNSLTADNSGVLALPGTADNYATLARQIAVFRDASDFIKDVKLTNAQLISADRAGVVGVGFQLRIVLQDNVFKRPRNTK